MKLKEKTFEQLLIHVISNFPRKARHEKFISNILEKHYQMDQNQRKERESNL